MCSNTLASCRCILVMFIGKRKKMEEIKNNSAKKKAKTILSIEATDEEANEANDEADDEADDDESTENEATEDEATDDEAPDDEASDEETLEEIMERKKQEIINERKREKEEQK